MTITAVNVRWFIRADLPHVATIDHASYRDVWTADDFLKHLRGKKTIGVVADDAGDVAGYALYTIGERGISIDRLAVHPAKRRRKIGQQLMAKLLHQVSRHKRDRISIMVREGNLEAQLFLRACLFKAEKIHKCEYVDTGEDGYLFRTRVSRSTA